MAQPTSGLILDDEMPTGEMPGGYGFVQAAAR
jgi:hypothetical protein